MLPAVTGAEWGAQIRDPLDLGGQQQSGMFVSRSLFWRIFEVLFFWNPPFLSIFGRVGRMEFGRQDWNTPCCCMVLGSLDPTDGFGPPISGVRSWSSKRSPKNVSGLLLIARFCSRKARVSWLLLPSFGLSLNLAWMYAEVQSIWSVKYTPTLVVSWHFHILIYSWITINCGSITMICPTSIRGFECIRMLHICCLRMICAACNVHVFSAWRPLEMCRFPNMTGHIQIPHDMMVSDLDHPKFKASRARLFRKHENTPHQALYCLKLP